VRGGYGPRYASLVLGLFLFAIGIVLVLESRLGLSPWDVLNQGLARHTPLSFGMANVAVALVVLLVAWSLGGPPGVGTVANAVLVGSFIQGLTSVGAVTDLSQHGLSIRIPLLVLGIGLIGPASAFYIGADLGAGPRDTLMLVGARRTSSRVGIVRATLELGALVCGILLGGTFGVGTVAFALLVGPVVEASFALLARSPLAAPLPGGPALSPQRQRRSDRQQDDSEESRPVQRDALGAEQAPMVDRRAHQELARDEDPDRRRDADARARVGDREHDQQAHDAAQQHPPRLLQGPRVAGEAVADEDQRRAGEHCGQQGGEAECLQHPDPLSEPRHDGDLHGAGDAGGDGECGGERAPGHGPRLSR
jgi:uncharacterized membrane protein YczE